MKIESIHLKNFLSHADTIVHFDERPLWLIIGQNGAGKSALFDAVECALYGEHRGGSRQMFEHLIRHNCDETEVEVIFRHLRQQYRLTRKLHREKGNIGGSLSIRQDGEWQPVKGVRQGKRAVWDYVEREIMPYELFVSSSYLKQGAIDFFLSGNATERGKRFARLMNLEDYTHLSNAADTVTGREEQAVDVYTDQIAGLGDVSKQVLQQLKDQLCSQDESIKQIERQLDELRQKEQDAREWTGLTSQVRELDADVEGIQLLLDEADAIQAAATLVQGWDTVFEQLQSFWSNSDQAVQSRADARTALADAQEQEALVASEAEAQNRVQSQLEDLGERWLPDISTRLEDARANLDIAKLEQAIAVQVSNLRKASAHLDELTGVEEAFANWEARRQAIPRLQAVVEAQEELEQRCDHLTKAKGRAVKLRNAEAESQRAFEQAQKRCDKAEDIYEQTQAHIKELSQQIARLKDEIKEHRTLSGEEGRCPVCDQELNQTAHAHVQKVIRERQADLRDRQTTLESAEAQRTSLGQELTLARKNCQDAERALEQAHQQSQQAEEEVRTLGTRIDDAQDILERSLDAVRTEAPSYAEQAPSFSRFTLEEMKANVNAEQQTVKADYSAFCMAREKQSEAKAQLQALRGRRPQGISDGLGDKGEVDTLARRVAALEQERTELQRELRVLKLKEKELTAQVQEHAIEVATAKANAENLRSHAKRLDGIADEAEQAAQAISVPEDWRECLLDRETYHAYRDQVRQQRPLAARMDDLRVAKAKLEDNRKQRMKANNIRQAIPTEHRIAPSEAQTELRDAELARTTLIQERERLSKELTTLEERQRQVKDLREKEKMARQRAKTFGRLARLLAPGGEIQLRVTASIQEEVRCQANQILDQINDGLEIRLSEPRRGGKAALDVVVFDRLDPSSGERYFEFLSGGEKFRVGLAVALAIHWRATKRAGGTVIVDEGFGALDSQRRENVAEQIANVSEGLLKNGLVEQILVSTHVTEVQSYFPYRWEISKQDGRAVVKKVDP